jgi:hypothetical protein
MPRGFLVKAATKRGFARVLFPAVMLIVGLLSLAMAQAAFACTAGHSEFGTAYEPTFLNKDAYVAEASPNSNYGTVGNLRIGYNGIGKKFHSYVHFPLPAVPPGCTVYSATLETLAPAAVGDVGFVEANKAQESWGESTLTWANRPLAGGTTTLANPVWHDQIFLDFTITDPVIAFYGGATNTGVILRPSGGPNWGINTGELPSYWAPNQRETGYSYVIVYWAP